MTDTNPALVIEPLTAESFRSFGDVIEASHDARHFTINEGFAERYHDLAQVDVATGGGRAIVSIFKAKPRTLPMRLLLLERHPLGSQAFVPMSQRAYLVVVAPATPHAATPDVGAMRCFRAEPGQGVNYASGTWHHPLIALDAPSDFLVVDRGGAPGDHNCDEYPLGPRAAWIG
ncbi:ureidoglycolate hydrolase [Rhodoferax koreense]|uniref:Ureidoglycolate hydrolase n=1 Tax=Rhodoferax koreensis TaxID=1842727 RepID=A0A1P8JW35_9BURK|nr:ureidoglycolate lyase [Rhodoferax koreense]APW37953.1 ureidoglycolate hydrolase [Rhodoferax koreense]